MRDASEEVHGFEGRDEVWLSGCYPGVVQEKELISGTIEGRNWYHSLFSSSDIWEGFQVKRWVVAVKSFADGSGIPNAKWFVG